LRSGTQSAPIGQPGSLVLRELVTPYHAVVSSSARRDETLRFLPSWTTDLHELAPDTGG
jgi:hypothetical protein